MKKNTCIYTFQYTYGVNAWKHWVVGKNAELERRRAEGRYIKPFETDILKLRADELNYTLCMFVQEARKPNGENYAPDSILYLTLGIQARENVFELKAQYFTKILNFILGVFV